MNFNKFWNPKNEKMAVGFRYLYNHCCFGSLAEWLNAAVLKTAEDASPP
jgi:hypothetical protein